MTTGTIVALAIVYLAITVIAAIRISREIGSDAGGVASAITISLLWPVWIVPAVILGLCVVVMLAAGCTANYIAEKRQNRAYGNLHR